MDTLRELLEDQIKDLHSAETQLTKALPKMVKKAKTPDLQQAFESHLAETYVHVERLEAVARTLEIKPTGKVCSAMKGLIEEGAEAMDEKGDDAVVDAGLVAAAQRIEHYEISAYGTARRLARELGLQDIDELLLRTEEEESAADGKLTEVVESVIYPAATHSESDDESGMASMAQTAISRSRVAEKRMAPAKRSNRS